MTSDARRIQHRPTDTGVRLMIAVYTCAHPRRPSVRRSFSLAPRRRRPGLVHVRSHTQPVAGWPNGPLPCAGAAVVFQPPGATAMRRAKHRQTECTDPVWIGPLLSIYTDCSSQPPLLVPRFAAAQCLRSCVCGGGLCHAASDCRSLYHRRNPTKPTVITTLCNRQQGRRCGLDDFTTIRVTPLMRTQIDDRYSRGIAVGDRRSHQQTVQQRLNVS